MSAKTSLKPTGSELQLLHILWQNGPRTVREIHERLQPQSETGYTTPLKILQRMTEKGPVLRDESERSHVYRAAVHAEQTQRQLVRHLLEKAFHGSPARLVMQALSEESATAEELAE